jgi:hypothetical protein
VTRETWIVADGRAPWRVSRGLPGTGVYTTGLKSGTFLVGALCDEPGRRTTLGAGSVFKRCGCREVGGARVLGARCPLLAEDDHGSWYLASDTPTLPSGDRRRVRRGGFATYEAAQRALDALRDPAVALGAVLTVSAWLKLWLAKEVALRESTRRSYSAGTCARTALA